MKTGKRPVVGEDKRMIEEPGWWSSWPLLPVKRPGRLRHMPELGLIHADDQTIVRLANLFDDSATIVAATKIEYSTVDALLADGWRVDASAQVPGTGRHINVQRPVKRVKAEFKRYRRKGGTKSLKAWASDSDNIYSSECSAWLENKRFYARRSRKHKARIGRVTEPRQPRPKKRGHDEEAAR